MKKQNNKTAIEIETRHKLISLAKESAKKAYAPYSEFRVGAAVLCETGAIYTGANIENASYGLSTCAERVAIASAYSQGDRNITAIAIACIDVPQDSSLEAKVPCGACRQWLQELARNAEIVILGEDRVFNIEVFLPYAFQINAPKKNQPLQKTRAAD